MISSSTRKRRLSGSFGRNSHGFSLVEIAICMGIAVFVLVALTGLVAVGLEAGRASREDTTVAVIAKNIFGTLSEGKYADIVSQELFYSAEGNPSDAATASYRCEIEVSDLPPKSAPESFGKSVHLRISWPLQTSSPNEQHFTTVLATYQ